MACSTIQVPFTTVRRSDRHRQDVRGRDPRHEELGDTIFIECMDELGVTRMALPPRVANAIAAQRDSLTTRRRSRVAKALAQARKERGEVPGFMKGRK